MRSDEQIIEGFRTRDESIILEFYNSLFALASRLLSKMGATQQDVEDLVQETVVSLYTNIRLDKYLHNPDVKLSTYAMQICKYRWYNLSKRKSRRNISIESVNVSPVDDHSIHEQIEVIERNNMIAGALMRLHPKCRKILRLFYWERKSMEEIATILDMRPNSVKNGKYRCMKKLTAIMEDLRKDLSG